MKSFTKTITITHIPLWIHENYVSYSEEFINIRSKYTYKCNECFKCGYIFKIDDSIGLACFENIGNKVLCNNCAKELTE